MHASSVIRFALVAGIVLVATAEQALSESQSEPAYQQDIRGEMKEEIDQLRAVRLTVKEVDQKNHKVTFEAQVSPEASFQSGQGAPIRIDQLKEGDEVRAAFDPQTGEVKALQVLTAEEKAKSAEEKAQQEISK